MCTLKQELFGDKYSNSFHGKPASTSCSKMSNPTWIPDDVYTSLSPLILIRHPARMIPSFYRTQTNVFKLHITDQDFAMWASLRWLRLIFDSYRGLYSDSDELVHPHSSCSTINGTKKQPIWPLVVDAEDVVYSTQAIASKLCDIWNIDSSGVQYSWKAIPSEERPEDKIMCTFFDTLLSSTRVIRENEVCSNSITVLSSPLLEAY